MFHCAAELLLVRLSLFYSIKLSTTTDFASCEITVCDPPSSLHNVYCCATILAKFVIHGK